MTPPSVRWRSSPAASKTCRSGCSRRCGCRRRSSIRSGSTVRSGSDRFGRISLGPLPVDPVVRIVGATIRGPIRPTPVAPDRRRVRREPAVRPRHRQVARPFDAARGGRTASGSREPARPRRPPNRVALRAGPHVAARRRSVVPSDSPGGRAGLVGSRDLPRGKRCNSSVSNGAVSCSLHPLYASAVYRGAATSRRRAMHRRLAELVTDDEERARHRALGAVGPDETIAAELTEAGQRARARGAWDSAAELMEQALRLTPEGDHDAVCRRGVAAAEYLLQSGDMGRAKAVLNGLLADTPPGNLRADGLRLLGEILYNDDSYPDAARVLEEAASSTEDRCLGARIQLRLAFVHTQLGDLVAAQTYTESALAWADSCRRDEPRRAVLAEALALDATVRFFAGQGVDWSRVEQGARAGGPRAADPVAPASKLACRNVADVHGAICRGANAAGAVHRGGDGGHRRRQ